MAPAWAELLGTDYARFREVVRVEAERLGIAFDEAHLDCGVLRAPSGTYGLSNVARLCRAAPVEAWPTIVGEHLRRSTAQATPVDFEYAASRLRLRVVPDRQVTAQPARYVSRELAADLHLALAIDKPEHVVFVSSEEPASWSCSIDELFERARANTEAEPPLDREDLELDAAGAPSIALLHGTSYYASGHVVFLDRYVPAGEWGHLIGVPDRHAVLAVPFDGAGVLPALGPLVRLAHLRFTEEPGAISDQLYWRHRDGALVRIACGVGSDGQPWVAPPEAFTAIVAG